MRLVTIGNLTLDEVVKNSRRHGIAPGGSALYVSAAATALGADSSLVSSIGFDYPSGAIQWLRSRRINLSGVVRDEGPNTRFRLVYRGGSRRLELLERGSRLHHGGITGRPEIVHLGPVFQEVDAQVARYARSKCTLLSLDVQGLIRSVDSKGQIGLEARNIDSFLELCDVVKASIEEGRILTRETDPVRVARWFLRKGPMYCLISLGRNGAVIATKNAAFMVPPYPEKKLVDATGAGDVLLAGWLIAFYRSNDALWSAAVGTAFASLIVRHFGLSKFRFSTNELLRRASLTYASAER